MPLYEYYCSDCRSKFELLVSYEASSAEEVVCTRCHGEHVRKLLSVFARPRAVVAGDGYSNFSEYGDYDEASADGDFGGGCGCGGACTCHD